MNKQIASALALAVMLALPSTALARHGADDIAQAGDDHGQVAAPHTDDPQHDATDDHGNDATPELRDNNAPASPKAPRMQDYDLRGSVVSADPASGTVVVTVKKAN